MRFENGTIFAKIAKHINSIFSINNQRPETPLPNIDSLKEIFSPAAKIYNWNILSLIFQKLNINVDPDEKSLIVSGDLEMIHELLKEIYSNVMS